MSSLPPPPHTVILSTPQDHDISSELELTIPPILLPTNKKHLLRQPHYRIPPSSSSSPYSPLSALQSGSLSYASTTHYRPAPSQSSTAPLRDILPIPDSIADTRAFALVEPFLFPLLFPLGCCTALFQSIYMVLPIFPAAVIVGIAGCVIIPFICIGTVSVTAVVVFKALMRLVQKQVQELLNLGRGVVSAVERVAKFYRDAVVMLRCLSMGGRRKRTTDDDGRTLLKRSEKKPGPSILKPTRPVNLQVYEELPPSPLPTLSLPTLRPRAASFNGSPTPADPIKTKAREVFRTNLEKEIIQNQLPTPPASDHTPSPPFGALDIPTLTPPADDDVDDTCCLSPPPHLGYFARASVSSIDLPSSTDVSSYAPTPKTPGSPLTTQSKLVKHVRIVEPCEMEDPTIYYFDSERDREADTKMVLREFAAAKLQDALGLLQTGAGQVWGS